MNIVRGRGAHEEERKKERTGVRARVYADVAEEARGDTRRNGERGTKGQKAGGREGASRDRERPRECEGEANDATADAGSCDRRGYSLERERRGRTHPPPSLSHSIFLSLSLSPARVTMRESEKVDGGGVPITGEGRRDDGGTRARRMRDGRGNARSCPDNPLPSLSCCRTRSVSVSLAPRLAPARALSFLERTHTLRPSRSLTKGSGHALLLSRGRTGEDRRPSGHEIQGPGGRARCYIRSGVLSIWVIVNANKDNTLGVR